MLDPARRAALRALAEKITPLPWAIHECGDGGICIQPGIEGGWHAPDDPNPPYIVAAANALPDLLSEVERLEGQRDADTALLRRLSGPFCPLCRHEGVPGGHAADCPLGARLAGAG